MAVGQGFYFLILVLSVYFVSSEELLTFGSFNVKTFGKSKMSDSTKATRIAEITSRYDIMLLQEIRDSTGSSYRQLLSMMQSYGNYSMSISERLGRSSYKEQYAFLYRSDKIQILDSYQYDDGVDDGTDVFEREPFCVLVHPTNSCTSFGIIALHSKPTAAVSEISALNDVRKAVESKWNIQDVMIMGDLNADCTYARESSLADKKIYGDKTYKWLIDWSQDTTTGTTQCAYDRIISRGQELASVLVADSAQVYLFDQRMNLSKEQMLDISDHYPVEVQLRFPSLCDPCSSSETTCSSLTSPQLYCRCKHGRPTKHRCKQTELWNDQKQSCQSMCPSFGSATLSYPFTCGQYIQCFWGYPLVLICPNFPFEPCKNPC